LSIGSCETAAAIIGSGHTEKMPGSRDVVGRENSLMISIQAALPALAQHDVRELHAGSGHPY